MIRFPASWHRPHTAPLDISEGPPGPARQQAQGITEHPPSVTDTRQEIAIGVEEVYAPHIHGIDISSLLPLATIQKERKEKRTYQADPQRRIGICAVEDSQHRLADDHHGADGQRHPPQDLLGDEPVARRLGALAAAVGRPLHRLLLLLPLFLILVRLLVPLFALVAFCRRKMFR